MKLGDTMSRDVPMIAPSQTIRHAARLMAELNVGALPVGENDRLIGTITDRDIALRAVANGRGPETSVRDIMTSEVKYCFEDESVEDAERNMGGIRVRRLPVVNRNKRLVGMVSLPDLAIDLEGSADEALCGIPKPGRQHS
jgi:CBS domain-containing protein